MSLHPPNNRRERILVFGGWGSGKSTTWLKIAEWLEKTSAPGIVRVLDSDRAWEAMDPGTLDGRVIVTTPYEWDEYRTTISQYRQQASIDDWLIVDMVDKAWTKAQEGYFDKAFGKNIDEFFIEARGNANTIGGDYGSNWQVINKMYSSFSEQIVRFPGHVLCCAPAAQLSEVSRSGKDRETQDTRRDFGRFGFKPQGQKDLGHLFHTILYLQQSPQGWVATTAKERNPPGKVVREYLAGEKIDDFVVNYLFKIAGWRP